MGVFILWLATRGLSQHPSYLLLQACCSSHYRYRAPTKYLGTFLHLGTLPGLPGKTGGQAGVSCFEGTGTGPRYPVPGIKSQCRQLVKSHAGTSTAGGTSTLLYIGRAKPQAKMMLVTCPSIAPFSHALLGKAPHYQTTGYSGYSSVSCMVQ